jgi:two-component system phosphate regulon response regulator PhoB
MAETVVFVVARDAAFRRTVARALWETSGLHAISMRGGEPAIAWARAARPALIVLDQSQPDMDAFALAGRLKQQPGTADIPILLMSDDGPTSHDGARAAGCDGFISKPFAIADLTEVVRHCIARRPPAPAGSAA